MSKYIFKQLGLFIIIVILGIYFYGFFHETTHFLACKSLGISGKININLFQNPPLYVTNCPQADQLSQGGLFIIRSAPYFSSAIIMLILLISFRIKEFYYLGIPTIIILSDWFNIFNIFSKNINYSNDFLQVSTLPNKVYSVLISLFLALTSVFYLWIFLKYLKMKRGHK